MSIFDISKKNHTKEIYSFGVVSERRTIKLFLPLSFEQSYFSLEYYPQETGLGDITYNSRRRILGAVPIYGKISYHLFNVDSNASKTKEIVKLIRKSKWHSQYSKHQS